MFKLAANLNTSGMLVSFPQNQRSGQSRPLDAENEEAAELPGPTC